MDYVKELNKKLFKKELTGLEKKREKIQKSIATNDEKLAKLNIDLQEIEKQLDELKMLEGSYR